MLEHTDWPGKVETKAGKRGISEIYKAMGHYRAIGGTKRDKRINMSQTVLGRCFKMFTGVIYHHSRNSVLLLK